MNDINKTAENIKRIENFAKYLKANFNNHKKEAKESDNFIDIENSLAFLKDYKEISEKLIEAIEAYDMKTAGEIIH